jgi:indolepyruvate ferredoxin oxidoreductase alpha subunit
MQKMLMLGDEAIAQAALDAGISSVNAYPGTPSTEITEYIQQSKYAAENKVHSAWSSNEKTAMEAALGVSYMGKRALVCMKHVGMNVAADAFINSAMTGVNGGLVVVAADDPSMHSSQNEQDSRFYAKFAMVPVLEPSNQQEAYDMTRYAFDLSEKCKLPVVLRITTRMAHSRAGVERYKEREQNPVKLPTDERRFILLPAIARKQYKKLLLNQEFILKEAETQGYNHLYKGTDYSKGIVACGLAYNYLMENYKDQCPFPILKLSQYPVAGGMLYEIYEKCDSLLILEEGYPFVEEQLRGILNKGKKIYGRLDGTLPQDGELNPNIVASALGMTQPETLAVPSLVAPRPPALCNGCGHIDMYNALNEALAPYHGRVFADIGCYTLGALPPLNSIHSCVDMGASITMAKGAADAGLHPSVGVIGDSTFTHSGMTGLLDAIIENTAVTIIISDNSTTGMTGGQKSQATGRVESICLGLGVDPEHLKVIVPLKKNHEENVKIMAKEFEYQGVSVIISQRECIQTAARHKKESKKE